MKKSRAIPTFRIALLILLLGAGTTAAQDRPELLVPVPVQPTPAAAESLDALLYDYQVFEMPLRAIDRRVRRGTPLAMHLGNRTFELDIERHDVRAPGYRVVLMREDGPVELKPVPADTYRGRVRGEPESVVRLTVRRDRFEGYLRTEHVWLFVDPLTLYDRRADRRHVVVYRDQDVRPMGAGWCGSDGLERLAGHLLDDGGASGARAPSSSGTVQIASDGDGELVQRYGSSGAQSRINTIINNVDGIYEAELNLQAQLVFQVLWSNPNNDPYTSTEDNERLDEFRDYWNSVFPWVSRDTAHLFTGVTLNGSQAGIAWVGVICRFGGSFSYGLSEDRPSTNQLTKLTAHEIGHNLDAGHDNQAPVCPGVVCNGSGPIMCSSIQSGGPLEFSNCSQDEIADYVADHGSCL